MSSEYLTPGIEVEFSGRGRLEGISEDGKMAHVVTTDPQNGLKTNWYMNVKQQSVKPLPAPHRALRPGQVWETPDGMYFVRVSRADIPYRLTPDDLSSESGLKTLDEDTFFIKYPDARLVFGPGKGKHRKQANLAPDHAPGNGNGKPKHARPGLTWATAPPYNMELITREENEKRSQRQSS